MMSEGSKAIKTCSIPSSSSRLSPLARPFTISNPFNRRESFDPLLGSAPSSTSTLDQPFPYLNLGDQSHRGYYAYQSDSTAITAFPFVNDLDFEFNSCFTSHPSEDPPVQTNFTPISSSLSKVGLESEIQGTSTNQQWLREVPRTNDQIATGVSLSCNNPLEQGTAIEGSKLVSKTPSVLHEKDCVVVGKDNRIRPVDEDKLHAGICVFRLANSEVNLLNKCMTKSFLISSDLPFSPRPQDNQSKLSYSVPLPTLSHCDSAIINNKICFPHLASCAPETLVSSEPKCISCSAQTFKPSGASYNATIVNPVPLENVPYGGTYTVSNMDSYSGNVVPGMFGSHIVRSPLDKVACQDLILTKKGEKIELVEPVHNETKIPCIMAKSKLQIACPTDHGDLSVEQHGVKAGIPDDKWSTNSDDSDVDSPCWKGTQVYKSSLRDSVPVNSEDCNGQSSSRESVCLKLEHSKNEKVARNSLNPLAPVFIPGNSKQKVDYHQKKCHGDGFSYIENVGALAVICSSREEGSRGSDKEGTCPSEEINDIGILWSSDVCDSREEYGTPYESFRNSAVNSCRLEPYLGEEYVSPESRLENFAGGMEGIADARYNVLDGVIDIAHTGKNSSILFPATEIALNLHSTGVGVSSDLTERFLEPLKSTPPKLDANLLINTIQYLSELLLQNYSFALGSMSEHEYDKVLNIINKLYVVIGNQAGERAVRSGPCHMCTLHGKRQVADNHKVTRKDPKVVHSTEHEMPPEALFYRKLWLEAKTALYYQEHGLHMKPEPDKC
ncbi:uncharacterized protein LOC120199736 isoform X2 [Hibiscus syriacus]|uniref:uncharacterized protein LOC120199736 isoform X2 n=1 Tax=Hibiscus syriacus TaxID=106335 RepID=UPI001923CFC3|nr:uncharacterized protein LOC120199736 isoform X2 [Hibiscus syriacus]